MMNTITQTQISVFMRCRRFYYLQMIRRLVWPAETGLRSSIRQGEDFHLLVRQLLLGLPAERLIIPEEDADVGRWIRTFLAEHPVEAADQVYAEKEVSAIFSGILWMGKFDALALQDDRLTIYDWKTGASRPDAERYRNAPQTRLYRFLARTCASRLLGGGLHAIPAENIEIVYWFPEYPRETIRLPYSEEAYQTDMSWLRTLSAEMSRKDEEDYPQTAKSRHCEYCVYRTHCFPERSGAFLPFEEAPEEEAVFQTELFPVDLPEDAVRADTIF